MTIVVSSLMTNWDACDPTVNAPPRMARPATPSRRSSVRKYWSRSRGTVNGKPDERGATVVAARYDVAVVAMSGTIPVSCRTSRAYGKYRLSFRNCFSYRCQLSSDRAIVTPVTPMSTTRARGTRDPQTLGGETDHGATVLAIHSTNS